MDLQSLKYFQFVAMYRNFSRAAEHFYIGQSALSRQIANLEKELGVQLFNRDTRNVNLAHRNPGCSRGLKPPVSSSDRAM